MFTALLPMKKNSTRVANKNLRPLGGVPLFYHVLDVLENCQWISEVIINTDSEEIANLAVAKMSSVRINWREESLLGDDVPMNKIIQSDLKIAANEFVVQTHSTNPFLTGTTLTLAKEYFLENDRRMGAIFSVNCLKKRLFNEARLPINHNVDVLVNTQDLSPIYEENSNFYFFSKTSFSERNNRISALYDIFVTPFWESLDIDTVEDFELAELLFQKNQKAAKGI